MTAVDEEAANADVWSELNNEVGEQWRREEGRVKYENSRFLWTATY